MRAVRVTELSGPSALQVLEVDAPVRQPSDVLVAVRAVAPAFPDLLLSRGEYQVKPELPFSPCSDFAGIVIESPHGSEFTPGSRVAGCLSYGAAAEQLSVSVDRVYPIPDEVDFATAAALPMNYLTAHFTLATRGQLLRDEYVVVLGASGGVGLASIQIAVGMGANVIAVVSTDDRATTARNAGADEVIRPADVPHRIIEITHGRGADLVVDVVGGDVRPALRSIAPGGRLMAVGFASGTIPTVKVSRLLLTNTDIRGVESAYLWQAGTSREAWDNIISLLNRGFVRPVVTLGGSLNDYACALQCLESHDVIGRTVLTVQSGSEPKAVEQS